MALDGYLPTRKPEFLVRQILRTKAETDNWRNIVDLKIRSSCGYRGRNKLETERQAPTGFL